MPFQDAQQLRLPQQRHLAHFVQEQRSQIGLLKVAGVIARGAGERARLVAEKLALHQVGRNGRAIDRQHRPIGARAGAMHGPGHQLLAGAAFAAHQYAAAGARQMRDSLDFSSSMPGQSPTSSS